MQLNTNSISRALIACIVTLILIGFYAAREHDAGQTIVTPYQPAVQPRTITKDPLKEYFDKQQQDAIIPHSQPQTSPPIQILVGNSTTTVPVGTDPFKAFLDAQSKAKPEEAAISPFSGGK